MKETVYNLGLDLGGTAIKYGICKLDGSIILESIRPTNATASVDVILNDLIDTAREALSFAKKKGLPIGAIGLGTPGNVNVDRGFLMGGTPNFTHWRDVPIKERMEAALKMPVFADNDANLMIYGEFMFGAGKELNNVVGITLGTGIGGGIVIEGQIFRGSKYAGAELGHMSIYFDGRKCGCGGTGCWERYASATAMIADYNELNSENPVTSSRVIFERYSQKDEHAVKIVEQEIKFAGVGIANLLNIFNPEMLIIGGGVSESGEWFIERIAAEARNRSMYGIVRDVEIVSAQLGNSAGWLGAAVFAHHQLKRGK